MARKPVAKMMLPFLVRAVWLGNHPARAALEDRHALHLWGDPRHELDGAGTGPDHADPLATQFETMVPARGMEDGTTEPVEPLDIRLLGDVQHPESADHHLCLVFLARCRAQAPQRALLVPTYRLHCGVEVKVRPDPVLVGAVLHVGEDLGLLRERPAPVELGLERIGVEVRHHIAAGTWIRVVTPGTADTVGLLENREALDPGALELDGHAEAAQPSAEDGDPHANRLKLDPTPEWLRRALR